MKKTIRHLAIAALVTSTLSACAPLGPIAVNPNKTYVLSTVPVAVSPVQLHKSITVLPVYTARGYDTSSMMYQTQPYTLAAFAQNAWIAPPAAMISTLLKQTLQQSQAFSIVVAAPNLSSTNYAVNTTLLALYQDFTVDPSEMVVSLDVSLVNNASNHVIGEKTFKMRLKTAENTPYSGVTAANQAVSTLLGQISQYVIMTIQAQPSASS